MFHAGNIRIYYHHYGGARRLHQDFLHLFDQAAGKTLGDNAYVDLGSARVIAGFTDTICNYQFYDLEFCLTLWNFSC